MPLTSVETVTYANLISEWGTVKALQHKAGDGSKSIGDIMKRNLSATSAAGAGNTGNGVMGTVTPGEAARIGAYTLTCTAIGAATAGTAAGAAVAGNTGDGTITAAPTVSAGAIPGVYRLVCAEPYTDLGTFTLEDPNGVTLGVVTVGSAYSANGLAFTITDGATDFAAGDQFTITVASVAGNGGTFKVIAPNGDRQADLTVGVAYAEPCFGCTLADGSTDFAVGDTFTITIADAGTVSEATGYENLLAGVLMEASDSTSAAQYPSLLVKGGAVREAGLNAPSGLTVAGFKVALKDQLGIECDASYTP